MLSQYGRLDSLIGLHLKAFYVAVPCIVGQCLQCPRLAFFMKGSVGAVVAVVFRTPEPPCGCPPKEYAKSSLWRLLIRKENNLKVVYAFFWTIFLFSHFSISHLPVFFLFCRRDLPTAFRARCFVGAI